MRRLMRRLTLVRRSSQRPRTRTDTTDPFGAILNRETEAPKGDGTPGTAAEPGPDGSLRSQWDDAESLAAVFVAAPAARRDEHRCRVLPSCARRASIRRAISNFESRSTLPFGRSPASSSLAIRRRDKPQLPTNNSPISGTSELPGRGRRGVDAPPATQRKTSVKEEL